jgi:Tfp pilus assembly protein PilN
VIVIDLTPASSRRYSLGVRRLVALRLIIIGVLGAVFFYLISLAVVHLDGRAAILDDLKSHVARLEQEVTQHEEARRLAQIRREENLKVSARREMVYEVFDMLARRLPEGLSLSKLRIAPPEAIVEGAARDAHALAQLLQALTTHCPRVNALVESVRNIAVGRETIASFQVRLWADIETNAAHWCRERESGHD